MPLDWNPDIFVKNEMFTQLPVVTIKDDCTVGDNKELYA